MVSFDEFKKLDIRIGTILSAEPVEGSDKLLKLSVDLGEEVPRQIVAGIRLYRAPETLIGKQSAFIANMEPRTIRGLESNGMTLAASNEADFALLTVDAAVPPGTPVR
jgi:methionine--tRNA ligase beta chain